jgi:hypothetical protein
MDVGRARKSSQVRQKIGQKAVVCSDYNTLGQTKIA